MLIERCCLQMLRNVPDAPQLPACYPAMMILALCPPLFHRIMDPPRGRLLKTPPSDPDLIGGMIHSLKAARVGSRAGASLAGHPHDGFSIASELRRTCRGQLLQGHEDCNCRTGL